MSVFCARVVQIGPELDKFRAFSDQVSVHFGQNNILKSDLKISQVYPFSGNLTHFGVKTDIPVVSGDVTSSTLVFCQCVEGTVSDIIGLVNHVTITL